MVTADEIMKRVSEIDENLIRILEQRIDDELLSKYDGEPLIIHCKDEKRRIIALIKQRYGEAGWDVQVDEGGTWFIFKAKTS